MVREGGGFLASMRTSLMITLYVDLRWSTKLGFLGWREYGAHLRPTSVPLPSAHFRAGLSQGR